MLGGVTRVRATRPLRGAFSGVRGGGLVHYVEVKVDSGVNG